MRARPLVVGLVIGLSVSGCARDWNSFDFTEGADAGADDVHADGPGTDASQGDATQDVSDANLEAADVIGPEAGDALADAPSDQAEANDDSGQPACTAPKADCNGQAADGCEVDLSSNLEHCGACSAPCPVSPDHASVACSGECVLTCADSFADCDRNILNGCEAPAQDYSAVVIADAPVGYWRLGEKSGTAGVDATGNGSTLTYVNGPLLGRPGAAACDPNSAVQFQSSKSTYASVPRNVKIDPKAAITIEYWVKEDGALVAGSKHLWYGDSNTMTASGSCWGFDRDVAEPTTLRGSIKLQSGGFGLGCTNCVKAGVWTHVALTYDGATIALWINGVSKIDHAVASPLKCTGMAGLAIGASNKIEGYLDGTIDEIAIYDKALTGDRLLAHYNAGL